MVLLPQQWEQAERYAKNTFQAHQRAKVTGQTKKLKARVTGCSKKRQEPLIISLLGKQQEVEETAMDGNKKKSYKSHKILKAK